MTPAEMREGVARAIREAMRADGSCLRGDICTDASCACCLEAADAALAVVRAAMREPDAGMLKACLERDSTEEDLYMAIWRTMFDASPLGDGA